MKKIALAVFLAVYSGLLMAEEVVVENVPAQAQVEEVQQTVETELKPVQIRAKSADLPAVPANVPTTTEGVTAKKIAESVNSVSSARCV